MLDPPAMLVVIGSIMSRIYWRKISNASLFSTAEAVKADLYGLSEDVGLVYNFLLVQKHYLKNWSYTLTCKTI